MKVTPQTQQIINAVKSIENETFKQENVSLMVNQDIQTGNEYIMIWYKE